MVVGQRLISRQDTAKSLQMFGALCDILQISQESAELANVLERSLEFLVSLPWLALEAQGAVFLVDSGQDVLVMTAQVGMSDAVQTMCHNVAFGHCLCGQAAASRQVLFADQVDERHVREYPGMGPHGHYCIPLHADGVLHGMLTLYVNEGHVRQQAEEDFLVAVADIMGGVIQRRQTEEALRKSEERFQLAIRGTSAGIWDWDLATNTVYFSPRWKSILGYTEDEIAHDFCEWESRLHPVDRQRALDTVQDYLSGKTRNYELEHRLRHKDGSYRWILARGAVVRDDDGVPFRMVGSHLDITERKQLESDVRHHEVELLAARTIQQRLWPQQAPRLPGFDIAGAVFPATFAGGDHFDFFKLPDGSLALVVADVSGHGVGASLIMASAQAYLRALLDSNVSLDAILSRLNTAMLRDTDKLVTLIGGGLDPQTRVFTPINAGHPPGHVFDASGEIKHRFESKALPLGVVSDETFAFGEPILLEPGDLLLMNTDGALDAMSPAGEMFRSERLFDVVRENRDLPAADMIREIHEAIEDYRGSCSVRDDVTVLIVKVAPEC